MRGYNNIIGTVAMRDKMVDLENAIKLANADGAVTYDELRVELKKWGIFNFIANKPDSLHTFLGVTSPMQK